MSTSDIPEPVAWRARDYADGWILCHTEEEARQQTGGLVEPLYSGGSDPTSDSRFVRLGMALGTLERILRSLTEQERRSIWTSLWATMLHLQRRFAPKIMGEED